MPTLTPEEIATMNAEVTELNNAPDPAKVDAQILQKQKADAVNKKFFDDDDLNIQKYEIESKNIDGNYPTDQVVEQDIIDASNKTGRIYDGNDVFRFDCFDGLPVSNTPNNETENKPLINFVFNELQNGFANPPSPTLVIGTWVGGIGEADQDLPIGKYIINDAVIYVTSTSVINNSPDPDTYEINFTTLVAGTFGDGDSITGHSGFSDSERSSKTATNPDLQGLMIYQLDQLDAKLIDLVSYLDAIISALQAVTDPSFLPATLTSHSDYRADVNAYKATLNIGDTDITTFQGLMDARTSFLSIRLTEIDARLSSLRDTRYNWAYVRANSEEGSLSVQQSLIQTKAIVEAKAASMEAQKNFYTNNLPLS